MRNKIISIFTCMLLIVATLILVPGTMSISNTRNNPHPFSMGSGYTNLISDNNHIIEINETDDIVWDYTLGTVDAERLENGNTLMGGSVLVKEIGPLGGIVWQYGTDLLVVSDVERLENNHTLITDFSQNFVREVNESGIIKWEITGLSAPMDAERLDNGNTLIVNNVNGKVIEVDPLKVIIWEYSCGVGVGPTDAERLSNGNTLITEQLSDRVIEVDSFGNLVWEVTGLSRPKDAERLENGNTLIVEYNNHSVIEVDSDGNIVWIYQSGLGNPNDVERVPNYSDPLKPTITGPTTGVVNIPLLPFIARGFDPGGNYIWYWIDWDDGSNTGWLGPYVQGTPTFPQSHTWTVPDTYTIKVKIKDVCGVESSWGTLQVTIPRSKEINSSFMQFLLDHPNMFPLLQLIIQKLII